jgi:hypothetical protein
MIRNCMELREKPRFFLFNVYLFVLASLSGRCGSDITAFVKFLKNSD